MASLAQWTATRKREIFDDLSSDRPPREGVFDSANLAECRTKGAVRMGASVYHPDRVDLEFLFGAGTPLVFVVSLPAPERIVYLPVPAWVVETIWQGEISGSHHFESEANRLLLAFQSLLSPEANAPLFGPQMARRRE